MWLQVGMLTIRLRDVLLSWEVWHSLTRLGRPLIFDCGSLLVHEAEFALNNFLLSGSLVSSSPSSVLVHTD